MGENELTKLQEPLTEIEVAALMSAAGAGLTSAGMFLLRKLAFERDQLRARVAGLLAALESCDVVMDTAALFGVGDILPQVYRDSWARVHEAARAALAAANG